MDFARNKLPTLKILSVDLTNLVLRCAQLK